MEEKILKQYVIDAFTDEVFRGNPAAICILEEWIPDRLMMSITEENRLSETAFAVREGENYKLRWFTPGGEIDLCGHATLAAADVILRFYEKGKSKVIFQTMSGQLTVVRNGEFYEMDFPAYQLKQVPVTEQMVKAIGAVPTEAYMGRDLLCVFDCADTICRLNPDPNQVKALDGLLLQVTAPGKDCDCVSRSFAPKCSVAEDPVCGSGHCHIVPYWVKRLNKQEINAYQASERSGRLYCRMNGDRVILAGKTALYSVAELVMEGVEYMDKTEQEISRKKKKVAFICVHNSCRSQIAEALGKHYASEVFESYSAGTETKPQINQDAVRIMKELYGIDMERTQYSKLISDIPEPDIAISMGCNVGCPFIGREFDDNWGLDDPTGKKDEEFIIIIREIERRIKKMIEDLGQMSS